MTISTLNGKYVMVYHIFGLLWEIIGKATVAFEHGLLDVLFHTEIVSGSFLWLYGNIFYYNPPSSKILIQIVVLLIT